MKEKENLKINNKKVPLSKTRIYKIFTGMKRRCYKPKEPNFIYYGAKGIKICDEWLNNFRSFYEWSINNGYEDNLTIDRINVNGNYCPENCRWTTRKEQTNNRTVTKKIEFQGEIKLLKEWAKELNISYSTLFNRISTLKNWSIEKAFTTPPKKWINRLKLITFNNETKTLTEWAKTLGISRQVLSRRLYLLNLPIQIAFTTPVRSYKKS